ncbi:MAG: hypothetical protein ACYC9Q_12525 [Bacillota bacterium]
MRRAKWELDKNEIVLELQDDAAVNREDHFPVLLAWMLAFLQGSPYVLEDRFDPRWDAWLVQYAQEYPGPVLIVTENRRIRTALLGATSPRLLHDHLENSEGLSWIAGLRLHAFETENAMLRQLIRWAKGGQDITMEERENVLFTLGTSGDAEFLTITPGLIGLDSLFEMAQRKAPTTGCEWIPRTKG